MKTRFSLIQYALISDFAAIMRHSEIEYTQMLENTQVEKVSTDNAVQGFVKTVELWASMVDSFQKKQQRQFFFKGHYLYAYAVFEHHLNRLANFVYRYANYPLIEHKDLEKLTPTIQYYFEPLGFEFNADDRIFHYNRIRNVFIHSNGLLRGKELKRFPKTIQSQEGYKGLKYKQCIEIQDIEYLRKYYKYVYEYLLKIVFVIEKSMNDSPHLWNEKRRKRVKG